MESLAKGRVRKWAEVVPNETDLLTGRLGSLKQYILYTYYNTFNDTGIFISVIHQAKHVAKDEHVQEISPQ